ncbi:MAG: RNA-binding S4 domain-containing protein [Solobacterium sp.]|nr:RNA-binding S4 domain-containing protein [Solobacterium sp.]
MRIDKFLKSSRILKRRTVSKELAMNERVEINGRVVKPSHEVKAGDIVAITFGTRRLEIRVLSTAEVKKKQDAADMYEIISETRLETKPLAGTNQE